MSVRPMTVKGVSFLTPAEMQESKKSFLKVKESSKNEINFQARTIAEGKKVTHSSELLKTKIQFASDRLEQDRLFSEVLAKRLSASNQNQEEVRITAIIAQIVNKKKVSKKTVDKNYTMEEVSQTL